MQLLACGGVFQQEDSVEREALLEITEMSRLTGTRSGMILGRRLVLQPLRLRLVIVSVGVICLFLTSTAMAQDAQTDRAKALLKQGIEQYRDLNFKQAQVTLLKVDASRLSASERKKLDNYRNKVNDAIKKQAEAMEAYDEALKALKAGQLEKARDLFEKVAGSEFVPEALRKDARAQRALMIKRIKDSKPAVDKTRKVEKGTGNLGSTKKTPKVSTTTAPTTAKATGQTKSAGPTTRATALSKQEKQKQQEQEAARLAEELQARLDRAKSLVAEGNSALDKGKVDEAIKCFKEAIKVAPEYKLAHERLGFAQSLMGSSSGLAAISRLERIRRIRKEQTEVRFNQALKRAREAIQAPRSIEDFEKANWEINTAQTLIETNKELFTGTEYRAMKIKTEKLLEFVSQVRSRWEKEQLLKQVREVEQRRLRREQEVVQRRRKKIAMLKARVRVLRDEQKYSQAVELCDRILKLDPNDTWAAEWGSQLRRFVEIMEAKKINQATLREEVKQINDIRRSQIPWYALLRYPENWPDITLKRKPIGAGEMAESEANREVRRKLRQIIPKLSLSGYKLEDAIQFLRDASNCSIHVKWAALETAGVTRSTPVHVVLSNVTIEKALRTILEDVGGASPLGFVVDDGVITISTKDDLSKETVTRVYDIRDLIVRIPNFSGPSIDLSQAGNVGNNNNNAGGFWGNNNNANNNNETNFPTRAELVTNILDMIRSTISPDTWRENGGVVGSIREFGGQMIVTQTPENHRALMNLLAQLREARALQINVEARFILVNSGFLDNIGIDLDFYFNPGSSLARTPDAAGTAWATDPLTGARLTQAGPRLTQWQGANTWTNKLTPLPMRLGSYGFTQALSTGVGGDIGGITSGLSALNIAGTFLDDIQVDFLVTATEAHSATRTLTAPRLTIYNGQRAYVVVGSQVAYVASLEPVIAENAAATRPDIATVGTGTVLDVEGTVSADRRYVTMTIRPSVTVLNKIDRYAWGTTGFIQLPDISTQAVECTVSVPDGGTLLLGGQKVASEVEREMGVPILSRIPILNRAFTNRGKVRDEETLLILVRPKIIIQKEYEEAAFPP